MIHVGVKHGRDYGEILTDLTEAVGRISDGYLFLKWIQKSGKNCRRNQDGGMGGTG